MKKLIYLLCLCAVMTACELETSKNGKLDGFWHLETVDTLATGGRLSMAHRHYFWAVQMRLLQLSAHDEAQGLFLMRFEKTPTTLRVHNAYRNDRPNDDPQITDINLLAPFGVNKFDETFQIEQLKTSRMVLRSETLRLTFRRF